ncbi:hypothetical protein TSOC_008086, partial [Tetrabaena socialis]
PTPQLSHEGCGWVHSVGWAPGDQSLLYTSHDAALGCVRGPQADAPLRLPGLPLRCLAVVSERLAVGGGWEGGLSVFTRPSLKDPWALAATLGGGASGGGADAGGGPGSGGGGGGSGGGGGGGSGGGGGGGVVQQMAALRMGAAGPAPGPVAGGHSACITGLAVLPAAAGGRTAARGGGGPWHVASAGLDGRVLFWNLSAYLS